MPVARIDSRPPVSIPGTVPVPAPASRIRSIDLLRGLVMIVMALDHARDLLHRGALTEDPLNLQTTTPALFLTRFVTHFCAPVFVFLAGTSAWLQAQRKSRGVLSSFLVKRGLWLILAELTFVNFGLTFDPGLSIIFLQTIWAIGISMVLLGLAVHLPFRVLLAIGLIIVFGHNALDFYEKGRTDLPLWYSIMHRQVPIPLSKDHLIFSVYPFLPWTGVMLLGYCFGRLVTQPDEVRRSRLLWLGLAAIALFIVVRWTNAYGDPSPWMTQANAGRTVLSFINVTKYPPSLLFLCITIGPALLFLAFFSKAKGRVADIISVYGSVPFFYFVLHFYVLHLLAAVLFLGRGHSVYEGMHPTAGPFRFTAPGEGLSLTLTYVAWLGTVAALYPLCRWFSNYKKTHKQWWLSYL
ncbi:DUF1624 domain-containing protein [Flaviaesturariibacter flavus]|uniref:DUF1624 domain-containing protein n=1 Tax=Flaviaesturariibacter flavus TaxID=2502780 RepID=A0A4V2NWJ8_9BACT|nr:heparan-alpha-glucosaminide N-acetyltransferase domain-containing protein [Flaviaesturariibacter flavus]TCJ17602.1 DUF1624 domain-containing protein [Flaviaesturariibacter flavus]